MRYPRPITLASIQRLRATWFQSKDNRLRGRAAGIDGLSPEQFKARLDERLVQIRHRMLQSDFTFQALRPNFIPKKNGGLRVICVPTVEDRLIQRVVLDYLGIGDKLGVRNRVSYGFHSGSGVQHAVRAARNIRREHRWALKSDIESFFNSIQRGKLKREVAAKLRNRSVVPFLLSAIDTEIRPDGRDDEARLLAQGIEVGLGLRQGMPLSPLLSNVVLRDFDHHIVKSGHRMVRYADDFVVLCDSEAECRTVLALMRELLAKKGHSLPALGEGSKTAIYAPDEAVEFLGFEISPEKRGYTIQVPPVAMGRVNDLCAPFRTFATCKAEWPTLARALQALNAKINSFVSSYQIANNFDDLRSHADNCKRESVSRLLVDMLGVDVVARLTPEQMSFVDMS